MPNILALWLTFSQAGANPIPATDVPAADIQATLKEAIARKIVDTPIRTVDAGGHNLCWSHSEADIDETVKAARESLAAIR